jgi:hypothetical protein
MSAYMSSNTTLNHIVSLFEIISRGSYPYTSSIIAPLNQLDYTPDDTLQLFTDLIRLNALSLHERYGDDQDETFEYAYETRTYTYHPSAFGTHSQNIQTYKYLTSYLYQSCEGAAFDTLLYKALSKTANCLAQYIISNTAEYQDAAWD